MAAGPCRPCLEGAAVAVDVVVAVAVHEVLAAVEWRQLLPMQVRRRQLLLLEQSPLCLRIQ